MGLQFKKIEELQGELGLQVGQLLPQFNKLMRKFTKIVKAVYESDIEAQMGKEAKVELAQEQVRVDMHAELDEEAATGVVAR